MEELLQKLLEADVLAEDTKKELETAFKTKLDEAVETAKKESAADVRAELTEQWVQERDALIEAVDTKVGEFLESELTELREDIDRFRDLEADYAEKLVEAKAQMANELKGDMGELVEKIDAFLEIRLAAEMDELREDIEDAKKKEFGRKIFEAFVEEYADSYADDESLEGTLRETEERLADTQQALEESERRLAKRERDVKLQHVLSPLDEGSKEREVMEAILRNVATEQLDEGYKTFIGRVIRETKEQTSEKEKGVLAEDASKKKEEGSKELKERGVLVTGDREEVLEENMKTNQKHLSESSRASLLRMAGVIEG